MVTATLYHHIVALILNHVLLALSHSVPMIAVVLHVITVLASKYYHLVIVVVKT